jgi:hypothetical protein
MPQASGSGRMHADELEIDDREAEARLEQVLSDATA